jgi:hypothetical protein
VAPERQILVVYRNGELNEGGADDPAARGRYHPRLDPRGAGGILGHRCLERFADVLAGWAMARVFLRRVRPLGGVRAPFPGPGAKWLISTDGGNLPAWSPTKSEILYNADGQIMIVGFTVDGGVFRADKPRPWPGARHQTRGQNRLFDVHPDGERLALAAAFQTPGYSQPDNVVFFFNFFDELRRIAPKQ